MKSEKITTVKQLISVLSTDDRIKDEFKKYGEISGEFFISFGALRSSKHISYDGKTLSVFNLIDDSEQNLTVEELMDDVDTNIGTAIRTGNFWFDGYN